MKRFLKMLGPGFITGASDDDPSGIGTYAMAGAAFGYATLWMTLVTFPMMAAIQFICAKLGMVTGTGLATSRITTGQRIRVDGSNGTVTILD